MRNPKAEETGASRSVWSAGYSPALASSDTFESGGIPRTPNASRHSIAAPLLCHYNSAMNPFQHTPPRLLSRRQMLSRMGTGLGMVGLAALLRDADLLVPSASAAAANPMAPKQPHFPARA